MPLIAVKIKNARPQSKAFKLRDGSGGYLLITPAGGKLWHLDYRFAGKRKTLVLGQYPEITLSNFRKRNVRKTPNARLPPGRSITRAFSFTHTLLIEQGCKFHKVNVPKTGTQN